MRRSICHFRVIYIHIVHNNIALFEYWLGPEMRRDRKKRSYRIILLIYLSTFTPLQPRTYLTYKFCI